MCLISNRITGNTHEDKILVAKKEMTAPLKRGGRGIVSEDLYRNTRREFLVSLERTPRARWDLSPGRILIDFGKR